MSTFEAIVSMLRKMPEKDLRRVQIYIEHYASDSIQVNPFGYLTKDEILEQLDSYIEYIVNVLKKWITRLSKFC